VKSDEQQYRDFLESKEPCFLEVAQSARRRRIARHRGEGVEAMMHRLQGTKPATFRRALPRVRDLMKKGDIT